MLLTPSVVQQDNHATALQPFRADPAALDLSDLSSDSMLRLRMSVSEFRSSGRRLIGELYVMTTQLCVMRDILGDRFRAFAQSELDLEPRMVSRYMHINKVLNAHFTVDGRVNLDEANMFTQQALALLSPATDTDVVESLRNMASQGVSINPKLVLEVMSQAEEDAVTKLASTQADLTAMTRELESMRQAREVERAKSQRELASQAEMLRRGEQRSKDLEDEIRKLQAQETQVKFETKEVVPPGFTSIEEAIAAKTKELATLASQREAATAEVRELADRQKKLQEAVEQTNAGTVQFLAMKEHADTLIAQFPIALLKSMSESDPAVKAAISTLGQTMVLFGQQLAKAGA
jgi:hypothetical protein